PSGSVTVPLMNLGKTITLPGSSESLSVAGRTCAEAGIAKARAGISNNPHLIINFMVPSFLSMPYSGRYCIASTIPGWHAENSPLFQYLMGQSGEFGPEGGTHPARGVRFPGRPPTAGRRPPTTTRRSRHEDRSRPAVVEPLDNVRQVHRPASAALVRRNKPQQRDGPGDVGDTDKRHLHRLAGE